MTYLAMQISLYLVSAALIGIGLGWLIWGRSQHRQIEKIHSEMTVALEAERNLSDEARRNLENAETKLEDAVKTEVNRSKTALIEVQALLENEKQAIQSARSENDQLRLDMEQSINAEKTSAANAIREAMRHAEGLDTALNEAKTRETQIRAELEELRLMAGADKLAAQTARSDVEQMRLKMQNSLDAERATSAQARQALNDIQETLARTFGEGSGIIAALNAQPMIPGLEAASLSDSMEVGAQANENNDPAVDVESIGTVAEDEIVRPAAFSQPITVSAIEVEQDKAPEDPTVTACNELASSEDPDQDDDNQVSASDLDPPSLDRTGVAEIQPAELVIATTMDDRPTILDTAAKPTFFSDDRPDEVDRLQDIDGIDSAIEQYLNGQGCYQFKQLAQMSSDDADWLARSVTDVPDLKQRMERGGWIEQAQDLLGRNDVAMQADRPRWWSRRRLQ